ncbi:MAG: T9SS type A sorting domain-containing protein, partial [Bacteroidota bacterium]
TWLNDGPAPVRWGDTSKDEMMVMIVMYVTDTTGVLVSNESPPVTELPPTLFPNPMQERATVVLPPSAAAADFTLFDLLGRPVRRLRGIRETQFQIERGDLPRGIYLYSLETTTGKIHTGKLVIE